jgi:2-dehydropantoate 2-reductase
MSQEVKTVSIIGLGALGILFGHHLASRMPAGSLRIIADQARIARYQQEGVFCNEERCTFNYVLPDSVGDPADLIIFAVKYRDLPEAIRLVAHQVGPETLFISLLNGITSESLIAAAYGAAHVLIATAQGMDAVKVGNRMTYHHMGSIAFGERAPGVISEQVRRLAAFFARYELPHQVFSDMYRRLWGKFMLNVGVNQVVAVTAGDYGTVQQPGEPRDRMIAAMREVIALAALEGIALTEQDLQYWLDILATLSPAGKPSMRQDLEAGRLSEVELFAGTVLALGEKYSLPTPVNRALYAQVKAIENQFDA